MYGPGWDQAWPDGRPANFPARRWQPVARPGGLFHRVGEHAFPLIPPGCPLVQQRYPVRMFVTQLQAEHLGEQRVVPVPPGPDRLDKRVRPRQGHQDLRGLLIAGQVDRGIGADVVQDAGAQQDLANLRWLNVEHFVNQVADQGATFGHQFLDELARVGMGGQGKGGEAQARRPALGALGQALQQIRRQRAAVLGQQQTRFGDAERDVAGPDLGQLPGQPVAVQRKQRVHARGDHEPQGGPGIAQHEVQCLQHGRVGQHVQVIKDQGHRRVLGGQRRGQPEQESVTVASGDGPCSVFGTATPDRRNAATT